MWMVYFLFSRIKKGESDFRDYRVLKNPGKSSKDDGAYTKTFLKKEIELRYLESILAVTSLT